MMHKIGNALAFRQFSHCFANAFHAGPLENRAHIYKLKCILRNYIAFDFRDN